MRSVNKLNIRPIKAFVLNNNNHYSHIELTQKLKYLHPNPFQLSIKFPMKEFNMKMHDLNYYLPLGWKLSSNQFLALDDNDNFLDECSSIGLHTCKLDFASNVYFKYDWIKNRFSINDLSFVCRVIHDIELEQ